MNQTTRHGLPLLVAGQAQKEVTHNEALLVLDRRLQMVVESRTFRTPPEPPAAGTSYIVPAGATGAWLGKDDRVAGFDGFGWTFDEPQHGWLVWIAEERCFSFFDGGWSAVAGTPQLVQTSGANVTGTDLLVIPAPSGGAVIDVEGRAALGQLLLALRTQRLIS